MRVVVCTPLGEGEDAGLDYFDDLRGVFAKGVSFAVAGGSITVVAEPTCGSSFADDTSYRLPVAIQYYAVAS